MKEEELNERDLACYKAGKEVGKLEGFKSGMVLCVLFLFIFAVISIMLIKNC